MSSPKAPLWQIALALGIVYVVWGSTYLAIRVAVGDIPPFLMAGGRWLAACGIMMLAGLLTRQPWPSWKEIGWASLIGWFLLIGGNGLVVWSEQYISSGMAALLVGSLPLWVLGIEAVLPGGARPTWLGVSGILLGLGGVAALVWPSLQGPASIGLLGQGLVLFGTFLWAIGTLLGRRVRVPKSGIYNTAFQMLSAAVGFSVLSLAFGEPGKVNWGAIHPEAWQAWGYLVVFGSCVAFSAFAWLVQRAKPELVSTYAYVNPVVAVLLGVRYLGEPLTAGTLVGAAMVVASVALVIRGGRPARLEEAAALPTEQMGPTKSEMPAAER